MECRASINTTLDQMGFQFDNPEQLVESWNDCLRKLCHLDEECSDTLVQVGQELLKQADGDSQTEDKLWMILEAIARRSQPDSLDLTIAALKSEKTQRKEAYVDILARFNDQRTIPAFIDAIKADNSDGEMGGWARSKAISALLRLKASEAATTIIPYVKDSVDRVREAAIEFLVALDCHQATPVFLEQLAQEDDPDNLKGLISGLVLWKCSDSLPLLRQLFANHWIQQEEDLHDAVEEAIAVFA